MLVIIGLCILSYAMNFLVNRVILPRFSNPRRNRTNPPSSSQRPPAKCSLDPNAPSVHPGFTNGQLQAFLGIAAVSALDIHPGLTNEQLAVLFAVAAAEVLGGPCRVVKFKPQNATEWAWTTQGRAELNSNGL